MKKLQLILALFLSAFAMNVKADGIDFSDTGGTYTKVTQANQILENDIIIIASWATTVNGGQSYVRIMTTEGGVTSGYFGYYTYNAICEDYNSMPENISIDATNSTGQPYEYKVNYINGNQITLTNSSNYLSSNSSPNSLCLTNSSSAKVTIDDNARFPIIRLQAQGSKEDIRPLTCENYPSDFRDNGCFTNNGGTNHNSIVCYRKTSSNTPPPPSPTPSTGELNIGATGYATLYYETNDVVLPEGLKAYTYNIIDNTLVISHIFNGGEIIPKGTAVVVKGDASDYVLTIKPEGESNADAISATNLLKGTDTNETTEGEGKHYMLSNGSNGIGFYYGAADGAAFTNQAHKAYLVVPIGQASKNLRLAIPKDDNTTSTDITQKASDATMTAAYDLIGRKVATSYNGVKIENGRVYVK